MKNFMIVCVVFLLCAGSVYPEKLSSHTVAIEGFDVEPTFSISGNTEKLQLVCKLNKKDKVFGAGSMEVNIKTDGVKVGDYAHITKRLPEIQDWSKFQFSILWYKVSRVDDSIWFQFTIIDDELNWWTYDIDPLNKTEWIPLLVPLNVLRDNQWDFPADGIKKPDLKRVIAYQIQIITKKANVKTELFFDELCLTNEPKKVTAKDIKYDKMNLSVPKTAIQDSKLLNFKYVETFEKDEGFLTDTPKSSISYKLVDDPISKMKCAEINYTIYGPSGYYWQFQKIFEPEDWSKYKYLCVWIKGNKGNIDQLQITFFDADGNWWSYTDSMNFWLGTGEWEFFYLPLRQFEDNPWDYNLDPGTMNLKNVKGWRIQTAKVMGDVGDVHEGKVMIGNIFLTNESIDVARQIFYPKQK